MKNEIYPLFPSPLMICAQFYEFSAAEERFLEGLDMLANTGNSMSKDDRVLDAPAMAQLREFVEAQLSLFSKKLLHIRDDNEVYITQSWVNRSMAGQYHPKHRHPNSVISGVLFLDNNEDRSLPPIRFHRAQQPFPLEFVYDELNEFNASCQTFDPDKGMLVLFPSSVEHDVDRNESGRTRSSLSFNTFVRGVVGGRNQLTRVEIS